MARATITAPLVLPAGTVAALAMKVSAGTDCSRRVMVSLSGSACCSQKADSSMPAGMVVGAPAISG